MILHGRCADYWLVQFKVPQGESKGSFSCFIRAFIWDWAGARTDRMLLKCIVACQHEPHPR